VVKGPCSSCFLFARQKESLAKKKLFLRRVSEQLSLNTKKNLQKKIKKLKILK